MDRIYGTLYSYCKTSQLSHTDGGDTWSNLFGISLKHKSPADVLVPPPPQKKNQLKYQSGSNHKKTCLETLLQ